MTGDSENLTVAAAAESRSRVGRWPPRGCWRRWCCRRRLRLRKTPSRHAEWAGAGAVSARRKRRRAYPARGEFPVQPPPAEKPGFIYEFGRWWDSTRGKFEEFGKQSDAAAKDAADGHSGRRAERGAGNKGRGRRDRGCREERSGSDQERRDRHVPVAGHARCRSPSALQRRAQRRARLPVGGDQLPAGPRGSPAGSRWTCARRRTARLRSGCPAGIRARANVRRKRSSSWPPVSDLKDPPPP